MPANDKTRKSVGYDLLKLMPAGAVLVNTARKEVIDEEGLLKISEERPDFKYLSDVEPDSKAVFEERYKNRFVFTAKKMGAQTEEANVNAVWLPPRSLISSRQAIRNSESINSITVSDDSCKTFQGLRPPREIAGTGMPSIDVMNSQEAAMMACGKDRSLLHITRAEIDLPPDTDIHSEEVYNKSVENFQPGKKRLAGKRLKALLLYLCPDHEWADSVRHCRLCIG